jgi:NADH dehydrogenase FAD-containing subunit
MQDIVIIGGGWYGCHIAKVLQDRYNVILRNRLIYSIIPRIIIKIDYIWVIITAAMQRKNK